MLETTETIYYRTKSGYRRVHMYDPISRQYDIALEDPIGVFAAVSHIQSGIADDIIHLAATQLIDDVSPSQIPNQTPRYQTPRDARNISPKQLLKGVFRASALGIFLDYVRWPHHSSLDLIRNPDTYPAQAVKTRWQERSLCADLLRIAFGRVTPQQLDVAYGTYIDLNGPIDWDLAKRTMNPNM